jgi:hypothetical protein
VIKDKSIICVSASFEQKEELLVTIKKYSRHYDERFAYWDEYAFTTDILPGCDAVLVFNTPGSNIVTNCIPENVIAFMMEPGIKKEHPWMFKNMDQYAKVYSPVGSSPNVIPSHGFLGWYFAKNYGQLKQLPVPEKTKTISCIASRLRHLEGHRLRLNFIKMLQHHFSAIDFFGKGSFFLPDKMDGLLPYRYSIALENTSIPHYFTEKINDCFLAYTVPVYYGCRNIGRYFPEKSFIPIDIEDTKQAIKKIQSIINDDDWQSRLNAIQEARDLVLNKYQPVAGAAHALREIKHSGTRKKIVLRPVPKTALKRIRSIFSKLTKTD